MPPPPGLRFGKTPEFKAAMGALETDGHPGIKASVDLFTRALRAGGGSLAATPLDDGEFTHRADNPVRGAAGRGVFCIRYRRSMRTDGSVTITFIDMWHRDPNAELSMPD